MIEEAYYLTQDTDRKRNWIRDLFLLPLIVGIIVAAASFGLPLLFRDAHELSYTVDGPVAYLSDPALGHVSVQINGVSVSDLFAYKVRLWNSGDVPLKTIPVSFVFERVPNDFQLFSRLHSTKPRHEFGEIKEESVPSEDINQFIVHDRIVRLVYQLINPGDEDIVTFLANYKSDLEVFAKGENVKVRVIEPQTDKRSWWLEWAQIIIAVGAAMSSVLTVGVKYLETIFWKRRDEHRAPVLSRNCIWHTAVTGME